MKLQTRYPGGRTLLAAIFGTSMLVTGSIAHASTAATATVRNIVTVNYADAASNPQTAITAAVDVTVNLVRANPVLNAPVDITTDAATAAVYNYTITNASNGITTYDLTTSVDAQSAGISGSTAGVSVTPITLGGTTVAVGTTIAAAGTTAITVPRDDTADTTVNGIAAGDTIVIGGQVFTVASVVDAQVPASPANGPYTTTITVNGNGTALPVNVADPIYERQSVTVTVTPGTVTDASVDQTIDVTFTVTDADNGAFLATDATVTTVSGVGLQVQKLVRNVDTAVVGSGVVSYFGVDYYSGGVTGNPGQVLEYLVVVSKTGAASATNVRVSDPIPPFTTYIASSMSIDNAGTGVFTVLDDSDSNGDAGETDTNTVYFYPGAGGTDGAAGVGNGTGGTISGANVSRMKFQVTIQ
ncbi:MAG: hypothetical protein Q8J78_03445 [Moraxellaceae bacterium]|nr:hypothetical protein [Moraxellaceae bacterium]